MADQPPPEAPRPAERPPEMKTRAEIDDLQRRTMRLFGPSQHRCYAFVEDAVQIGWEQFPPRIGRPVLAFLKCLVSKPGEEPPRVPQLERPKVAKPAPQKL
eukprot:c2807_g1_i2.p1 GENE.c2807_g1_i2~~c2807_g1_i2.p1  ORF type:complete len:101 (-),score=3.75 c2807_g1_i2:21-323(-)